MNFTPYDSHCKSSLCLTQSLLILFYLAFFATACMHFYVSQDSELFKQDVDKDLWIKQNGFHPPNL